MKHIRISLFAFVAGLVCVSSMKAQDETQNLEDSPLKRLVGTWEKKITIHPSVWFPNEQRKTGRHTSEWVLGGHHLRESGVDSDGQEYISFYSFNRETSKFGYVMYLNNPTVPTEFEGRWMEEEESFSFRATVVDGIVMTATYRFPDEDHFELSVIGEDRSGQTYFKLTAEGERVSEKGN